jgi:hypothetical protein
MAEARIVSLTSFLSTLAATSASELRHLEQAPSPPSKVPSLDTGAGLCVTRIGHRPEPAATSATSVAGVAQLNGRRH